MCRFEYAGKFARRDRDDQRRLGRADALPCRCAALRVRVDDPRELPRLYRRQGEIDGQRAFADPALAG